MIHYKRGDTHRRRVSHRKSVHTLCCRSWIGDRRKNNAKKKIVQSSSPTTMQTKQKNLQKPRKVNYQIH